VVAQDYQQLLVRRAVPTRRVVVAAALAHVQAIDEGKVYWSATLDNSPAHARYVAITFLNCSCPMRDLKRKGPEGPFLEIPPLTVGVVVVVPPVWTVPARRIVVIAVIRSAIVVVSGSGSHAYSNGTDTDANAAGTNIRAHLRHCRRRGD
jgi:hypothetical protein